MNNSCRVNNFRILVQNKTLRYLLYVFIALTAFGAGTWLRDKGQSGPQPAATPASAADALFALTLPDLNNQPQSLGQWRGKVVVVNFWATWCAPCREEIPVFVKLQDRHRDKGLQFVGISIDQLDKTREFAASFKINYPTLVGAFDAIEVSQKAGNVTRVLPFTVILDRKGRIAATELGGLTEEKLESLLKSLL
jgi:thiol-disulfide isomerase/thioredoxin